MSFIKPQLNDPVVESLRNCITKMQKANKLYYIGELSEESYELEIEDFHKSLEAIIKDRFGIKIKPKDVGFFAIYPIFDIDKLDQMQAMKKDAKKGLTEASVKTDIKKAIKNAREFKKWLNKNTLVIDTENAYIEKLPSTITLTMYTSIKDIGYGRDSDLTPDELTAVILHEIGHVFNSLEAFTNVHHTTQRLLDTFLENNLGYVKELGITLNEDDPYVIKNKDKKDIAIKVYEDLDKNVSRIFLGQLGIAETNSEFEADSFATRFGLGDKLSSALIKFKAVKSYNFRYLPIITVASMIKFMLTSLISILVFVFTGSLALFLAIGLSLYVLSLSVKLLLLLMFNIHTRLPNFDEHGTLLTRLENIKLQVIQMIRRSDISQKDKEKLLTTLEHLDDDIMLVDKSMADSILAAMFDIYSAPNMSVEDNLARIVDRLINNGLWVHTVKYKKLLRNISQEALTGDYIRLIATSINETLVSEEDSIQYQGYKDPIVKELIEFYTKVTDNSIIKNVTDYFELADELSYKIKKRFGLRVIVMPATLTGGFAAIPFRLADDHPFFSDKNMAKYPLPLGLGGIISYISYANDRTLLNNLRKDVVKIEVDLKKGYVSGLRNYANFIFIEFGRDVFTGLVTHKVAKGIALTPAELAAVTLHEIGHLFTYLKELKSSVVSVTILRDRFLTLQDEVDKITIDKNDPSVIKANESLTGFLNVIKNLANEILFLFVYGTFRLANSLLGNKVNQKLAENYAKRRDVAFIGNIRETMTMSETEADNFTAMFGLTKELTNGLNKYMGTTNKSSLRQIVSINAVILASSLGNILNIGSLPFAVLGLIVMTIIRALFGWFRIIFGEYFPYEKFPNRIKRLKQDLIKILRKENLDNETVNEIVKQIDFLYEEVMELEKSPAGSLLANVFSLNPSLGKDITVTQRRLDMLLDMIENDQWYFSKKFLSLTTKGK